jgi:membrane dipeptidase
LQAGGVQLQVLPVCTEEQYVGEGALRRCLQVLAEARQFADVHADSVAIAESGSEITEIIASGRIALVLAIEGSEPVGSHLEVLDALRRAGVRMCSLTWNRRTMMADGIAERDTGGRLTKLGVEAVRFMESLGMVVDVSHLSEAGFYHLADVAERPFIASHSSCRALLDHPRNLTDQQLAAMASSRSFVGINAFGPFLTDEEPSYRSYADHVQHALAILGPDLVGFGADFIDDVAEVVDPVFTGLLVDQTEIPTTRGLQRPADFPHIVSELQSRLGEDQARRVAGENLIDFLTRQLS